MAVPVDLSAAAAPVLATLADPAFAAAVAARADLPVAAVQARLADIAGEARLALGHLARPRLALAAGQRVLEVGAGTGALSTILARAGLAVTALEPIVAGFDLFDHVHAALRARHPDAPPLDRREARALDPARDGRFDRIVSINVLEHCRPLGPTLDALAAVLAPGGRMLHACPNYRVPYEPHLGAWLVPGRPAWTARLRPRLADDAIWRTLNFITAGDLRRSARRHGLELTLEPGVLGEAIARIGEDPAFARRQGGVARVAQLVERTGLAAALPAAWVTPMVAIVVRPA
ncbi:MAG: class I SAM-dependent methyltransferase [Myxococcales bacterium]|nr:class I SAM-dependent methyltransferase [Myxococcales bacterium]